MTISGSEAFANYCAAIRGNGELMPAHWGAMSSLVEEQGLPSAMAGGSSASITMFLLESLSLNPIPVNNSERALLIKSFQGYFEAMSQTSEGKAIQALLADRGAFQSIINSAPKLDEALAHPANRALLLKHMDSLQVLMASEDLRDIINPEFVLYVKRTIGLARKDDDSIQNVLNYRTGQISYALKNFGKFDAQTDKTLFVRPGLINFTRLSLILGEMGNFYANYNNESATGNQIGQRLRDFLNLCTPGSKDMSWRELNQQRPACRQLLGSAVLMYHKAKASGKSRIHELIGSHIPSFASTSVLTGSAVKQFARLAADYQTTTDTQFGDFSINFNELRFGYWGFQTDLDNIQNTLNFVAEYKRDAKSQKFLSLGQAPWLRILSTSPAEPGLSRIVALSRSQLSAGGWSDLHPVIVLKAYGCNQIIYVTRKGEESKFAQAVFKRLTRADEKTWSRFYDMANPNSSIMLSQKLATKIKCTDWDHFKVKDDINGLIEDAMRAPLLDPPYCK